MDKEYIDTIYKKAELLKAIGNPVRLCVLGKLCSEGELKVSDIQGCTGASQPLISQNLRKLKDLGIVRLRKEGTSSYYSISNEMVKNIVVTTLNWRENE